MSIKLLFLLPLMLTLLGCATMQPGKQTNASLSLNKAMTKDSVNALVHLYPPANTGIYITQSAKDSFGLTLIQNMRQRGYSINQSPISRTNRPSSSDLVLYYMVDEPIKGSLYRVTLIAGHQSLSRAYKIKDNAITPLGVWVRKE
jgi:hypothetical protein